MSVYGTSSGSKANIYGSIVGSVATLISQINAINPSQLTTIDSKYIDTTELASLTTGSGLSAALDALGDAQIPNKFVSSNVNQTISGNKTFTGGLNSSNLTLTGGTTANDSAITLTPFSSAGQRQLRFQEIPANGTDYVAIRAPSLVPTTYTLTLPQLAPPVSSSLLTSNTSGTLTWSDSSSFVSSTNPSFNAPAVFWGNTSSTLGLSTGPDKGIGFTDSTATYTTTLKSGAATQTYTLSLPTAAPTTASSLLSSSTAGVLGWTNPGTFVSTNSIQTITAGKTFQNYLSMEGAGTSSQSTALFICPYGTAAGNTRELRFLELAANGTNYIGFKAADNMATTNTYTLPSTAPTQNGSLLSTSTAGILGWTDPTTLVQTTGAQSISGTKTFADGVISNQYLSGTTSSSFAVDIVQNVNSSNARIEIQNTSSGASASSGIRIMADTANAADISLASSGNTTEITNCLNIKNTAGDVRIFSAPATSASITVQASTGNVGILDTAPTQALSVYGSAQISSNLFLFGSTAQLVSGAASSTYSAHFQRTIQGDHTLNVQNNATGNSSARSLLRLGMGASGPNGEVSVHSNVHTTQANHMIVKNNTSGGNIRLQAGGATTFMTILNTSNNVGLGVDTPTYLLQLSADSAAKPTSSTWTISSDERLKTDIQDADLDICYENIKKIPLRRYKWRPEAYDKEQINDDWRRVGFIAQEYAKIFPKDVKAGLFQKTHKEEIKVIDDETKEERTDYKTVVDFELKDCLSINTDQIITTLVGAVKKIQEVIDNQAEASDYTVSPMQMQISEGYGIVSNSIKHFNNKNVATLSFNFIVDDDVSATEWLELPLLQECKSVMLSNIVYIDEHGFDADRPFKIALSKSIDKLKVSFRNLNLVEKNIQKKLLINYILQ